MKAIKTGSLFCIFFVFTISSCTKVQDISSLKSNYSDEEIFKGIAFMDGSFANAIPEITDQVDFFKSFKTQAEIQGQQKIIKNIMSEIKKSKPTYFANFASAIKSHDQYRIIDELKGLEDVVFQAIATHYNIKLDKINTAKEQIQKLIIEKQKDLAQLGNKFRTKQITHEEFKQQMLGILKFNNGDLSDLLSNNSKESVADVDPQSVDAVICLSVLAFNVGVIVNVAVAVNVGLAVNVAVGVNVAIGYNVAIAVNKHVGGSSNSNSNSTLYFEKYINSIANAL